MIKTVRPNFFHRTAWQVFQNTKSCDIAVGIIEALAILFGEEEEA